MKKEKDFAALEAAICPICGVKHNHNCGILLDTSFKKGFNEKEAVTHWDMCEKHDKLRQEGYVFCIGIDVEKSNLTNDNSASLNDVYRTGKTIAIQKEIAEQIFPEVQDIMFVTDEFIEKLHAEYNKQNKCN